MSKHGFYNWNFILLWAGCELNALMSRKGTICFSLFLLLFCKVWKKPHAFHATHRIYEPFTCTSLSLLRCVGINYIRFWVWKGFVKYHKCAWLKIVSMTERKKFKSHLDFSFLLFVYTHLHVEQSLWVLQKQNKTKIDSSFHVFNCHLLCFMCRLCFNFCWKGNTCFVSQNINFSCFIDAIRSLRV